MPFSRSSNSIGQKDALIAETAMGVSFWQTSVCPVILVRYPIPCVCMKEPPPPCWKCGQSPCVCIRKTKVKLANGKERTILQ